MKETQTGLIRIIDKKLGAAILEEAIQQNRKTFQTVVVSKVQHMLVKIEEQREHLMQVRKGIEHLESQVKAINAGEFTIEGKGEIAFKDPSLGRA